MRVFCKKSVNDMDEDRVMITSCPMERWFVEYLHKFGEKLLAGGAVPNERVSTYMRPGV